MAAGLLVTGCDRKTLELRLVGAEMTSPEGTFEMRRYSERDFVLTSGSFLFQGRRTFGIHAYDGRHEIVLCPGLTGFAAPRLNIA